MKVMCGHCYEDERLDAIMWEAKLMDDAHVLRRRIIEQEAKLSIYEAALVRIKDGSVTCRHEALLAIHEAAKLGGAKP